MPIKRIILLNRIFFFHSLMFCLPIIYNADIEFISIRLFCACLWSCPRATNDLFFFFFTEAWTCAHDFVILHLPLTAHSVPLFVQSKAVNLKACYQYSNTNKLYPQVITFHLSGPREAPYFSDIPRCF